MTGVHVRVRVGGEDYALPVEGVREVANRGRITPVPGAPPTLGVWNLRGEVMAIVDLAALLGLEDESESTRVVIAEEGDIRAGFAVESVVDVGPLAGGDRALGLRLPLGRGADRPDAGRGDRSGRGPERGHRGSPAVTALDPETMEIAREEANECLERIEIGLLALEGKPDDLSLIDALFRDSHSVKGAASMVGWQQVASIAHGMEDRLETARDQGALAGELVDPLLKTTDELRRAIEAATGAGAERAPSLDPAPPDPDSATKQRSAMRVDSAKVDRVLDTVGEAVLHHGRLEHIVGERIAAAGDDAAEEELDRGERLLGELQDSVIEMRTLPLSSVTSAVPARRPRSRGGGGPGGRPRGHGRRDAARPGDPRGDRGADRPPPAQRRRPRDRGPGRARAGRQAASRPS